MTKREEIVQLIIKKEWNSYVGGLENDLEDGFITEMPSRQSIIETVYKIVINTKDVKCQMGYMPVAKDIRFLGKEKIMNMVVEYNNKHQ